MCLYVPLLSVCLFECFVWEKGTTDLHNYFLEVIGKFQGSVSQITNNYFDVFDVTHVKHKETLLREKWLLKLHSEV